MFGLQRQDGVKFQELRQQYLSDRQALVETVQSIRTHARTQRFPKITTRYSDVQHEETCPEAAPESAPEGLTWRQKGLNIINHVAAVALMAVLVLIAMVLLCISIFEESASIQHTGAKTTLSLWYIILDYLIIGVFALETLSRLLLVGLRPYVTSPLCVMDLMVSTFDVTLIALAPFIDNDNPTFRFIRVLRLLRLFKISRIARLAVRVDEEANELRGKDVTKDEDGHIYGYNSANLFTWSFLFNISGTVLAMPDIWVMSLFLLVLSTIMAAYTCPQVCDPLSNAYEPADPVCSYCINSVSPDYALLFMGLAAFLLGLFAQLLFDRWWQIRTALHCLFSEVTNTVTMSLSFIDGQDVRSRLMRRDIIRWAKLGVFLLERHIDRDPDLRDAVERGYMKESEWDELEDYTHAYMLPQQWCFDTVCRAALEKRIPLEGGTLDEFILTFTKQRDHCDNVVMTMETPMPYIFTHLMTLICKINLFFTAFACGTVAGQGIFDGQYAQVVAANMIVIFGTVLIEGLLRLHVVLADPFGDDPCDLPWEMMLDDLDYKCTLLARQFDHMPYGPTGPRLWLPHAEPPKAAFASPAPRASISARRTPKAPHDTGRVPTTVNGIRAESVGSVGDEALLGGARAGHKRVFTEGGGKSTAWS